MFQTITPIIHPPITVSAFGPITRKVWAWFSQLKAHISEPMAIHYDIRHVTTRTQSALPLGLGLDLSARWTIMLGGAWLLLRTSFCYWTVPFYCYLRLPSTATYDYLLLLPTVTFARPIRIEKTCIRWVLHSFFLQLLSPFGELIHYWKKLMITTYLFLLESCLL